MIVDDNPTNLQILIRILEGSGHRMLVAKSGNAAMKIVHQERPDLILLDVQMPEMNGFEVCKALKNNAATRDIVIIFLSAQGDVADKVAGLELGASDYITKPFQAEEVLARVGAHLLRHELERQLRITNDRLEQELRAAGAMQRMLLPRDLPCDEHICFAAHYRTSLQAGGDYYDILPLGEHQFAIIVADVAGHGAGAAIVMSMIRTMLHCSAADASKPDEILLSMNRHFEYLRASHRFATAVYAVIDARAREISIARAGHHPPMLLRGDHCITQWQSEGTLPLFIDDMSQIPVTQHALEPGDRLLFFTDGVTDVMNPSGGRFELNRLAEALMRHPALPPAKQLDLLVAEIDSFAEGREPSDDVTMLLAGVK